VIYDILELCESGFFSVVRSIKSALIILTLIGARNQRRQRH
jgi:hypothetical protein